MPRVQPPEDPRLHPPWFRAQCHKLLRHKSDDYIARARTGSVLGLYNSVRELPDTVDMDAASREAEVALAEQREWRGLDDPDSVDAPTSVEASEDAQEGVPDGG